MRFFPLTIFQDKKTEAVKKKNKIKYFIYKEVLCEIRSRRAEI